MEGSIKFTHLHVLLCTTHTPPAHSPSSVIPRLPIGCWTHCSKKSGCWKFPRFVVEGLERNTESSNCVQSPQQVVERGAVSPSFWVCEWLLILLFSLLSHAVRTRCAAAISLRSDIPGFSWNCSFPRRLFCQPAGRLIPSPHPVRFRAHTWKTFLLNNRISEDFVPPARNQKTFLSTVPLHEATEKLLTPH